MALVTGQDVADFLGQGTDAPLVALAEEHVTIVTAMVRAYTRGGGFNEEGEPNDEIAAVITTATARLVSNPGQLRYGVADVQMNDAFRGFSLAETFVLNRYRKKAH